MFLPLRTSLLLCTFREGVGPGLWRACLFCRVGSLLFLEEGAPGPWDTVREGLFFQSLHRPPRGIPMPPPPPAHTQPTNRTLPPLHFPEAAQGPRSGFSWCGAGRKGLFLAQSLTPFPTQSTPPLSFLQPRVLQPPRPDPQVRPQHVSAVLPPVCQGHRLH